MNIPHSLPASAFRDGTPQKLTAENEKLKRELYEKIPARRRRLIDRMGYENWDPFPKPNDPMEIRQDVSHRTVQQLLKEFLDSRKAIGGEAAEYSDAYRQAALECAIGLVNKDDKYLGFYDFSIWYFELLKREGHYDEELGITGGNKN